MEDVVIGYDDDFAIEERPVAGSADIKCFCVPDDNMAPS